MQPTGEREEGKAAIEPAFDDETGNLIYILTPEKAPLPTHADEHAIAPLYMVVYPPGSTALEGGDEHFNCEGLPGNCPDHAGLAAGMAVQSEPDVYGHDPSAVPGHDHLLAPPASHEDFNVAWEVIEVVFTNEAAGDTRITTEDQLDAAEAAGDVDVIDLGVSFDCSVVSAMAYEHGTPVGAD